MRLQSAVVGRFDESTPSCIPACKLCGLPTCSVCARPLDIRARYAPSIPLAIWSSDGPILEHRKADIGRILLALSTDIATLRRAKSLGAHPGNASADLRLQLERFARHCLALTAPIRALPTELLSEIFRHVHAPRARRGVRPHARDPTVALTLVCRRWRAAAAADRQLWTRLDASYSRAEPAHPRVARRVLAYSRGLPLDVRLWLPAHGGALAGAHAALCAHCRRWRRVDADVFRFGAFLRAHGAAGGMPLLEHLRVRNSHTEAEELAYVLPAPRLRSLGLHSPCAFVCSAAAPWVQLVAYSGPAFVNGTCVLPLLGNVETCDLVGRVKGDELGEPVKLARLRALRVSDAAYLRLLITPFLEICETPDLPAVAAFLRRSSCTSLKELRCTADDMRGLPAILSLEPALRTLGFFLDGGKLEGFLAFISTSSLLANFEVFDVHLRPDPRSDKPLPPRLALADDVSESSVRATATRLIRVYGYDIDQSYELSPGLQIQYHRHYLDAPFTTF